MRTKIEASMYLLAVVAVTGPLTQPGASTWLNSAIGVSVFVVLAIFTWPRRQPSVAEEVPTWPVLLAQSIVYGLLSAMGAVYFVQGYIEATATRPSCAPPPRPTDTTSSTDLLDYLASLQCQTDAEKELTASAIAGSLQIGLLVAGLVFVALLGSTRWIRRIPATEHGDGTDEKATER